MPFKATRSLRGAAWLLTSTLVVRGDGLTQEGAPAVSPAARPARGFSYLNDLLPDTPWSIHVVRIQRSHAQLELHTTLGRAGHLEMASVSEQVKSLPSDLGLPVAAVNGDFYEADPDYEGRPRDLQIRFGELITNPGGNPCFWIDPSGNPRMTNIVSRLRVVWPDNTEIPIQLNAPRPADGAVLYTAVVGAFTRTRGGREFTLETAGTPGLPLEACREYTARLREVRDGGGSPLTPEVLVLSVGPKLAAKLPPIEPGTTVRLITETVPNLLGVKTAIGGGPVLVRNGRPAKWPGLQFRHPRTAVGWNADTIFLVEVDGRQNDLSVGMSFPELAAYMAKLGCEEALNLDGGGSATCWVLGNVMNSPSEGRERPAPNALVLVEKRRSQ